MAALDRIEQAGRPAGHDKGSGRNAQGFPDGRPIFRRAEEARIHRVVNLYNPPSGEHAAFLHLGGINPPCPVRLERKADLSFFPAAERRIHAPDDGARRPWSFWNMAKVLFTQPPLCVGRSLCQGQEALTPRGDAAMKGMGGSGDEVAWTVPASRPGA